MCKLHVNYLCTCMYVAISLLLISNGLKAENIVANDLGMDFVKIPAGHFKMGISEDERQVVIDEMEKPDFDAFVDEQPQHTVKISNSFLLGKTEVTQSQWLKVMENKPGPKENWQQENWQELPVVSISWFMAKRFTDELSKMDSKYNYRLPTEAEWEYAARAGNNRLRPVSIEKLKDYAWRFQNSGDIPHPVASLKANAFGVHDMLGNVWEWVADWYAPDTYIETVRVDPSGPEKGLSRVRRGGSYHCPLFQTRPNYRSANTPGTDYPVIGFRVVASVKTVVN
jgi:formylglycine-generating enzyme required for sulfatase activity